MQQQPATYESQDLLREAASIGASHGPGISIERLAALEERIRQLENSALVKQKRPKSLAHGNSDDSDDSHDSEDSDDLNSSNGPEHLNSATSKAKQVLEIDGRSISIDMDVKVIFKKMARTSETSPYKESNPRRAKRHVLDKKEETAMTFTTYFKIDDKDGRMKTREKVVAELISPRLVGIMRDALQPTLKHGHTLSAWENLPVILDTSSDILTHCIDDLRSAAVKDTGDDFAKKELLCFLYHLAILQPQRIALRETASKQQEVAFGLLWTLFPAGCEVVVKLFQETEQLMKVHRYYESDRKLFVVVCWCYDWDGNGLVQRYYEFVVAKYDGLRPLVGLPCYPLELYNQNGKEKSGNELREALITRGKLFRDYCVPEPAEKAPRLYRTSKMLQRSEVDKELEMFNRWQLLELSRYSEGGRKLPVEEVTAESKNGFEIVLDAIRCQQYAGINFQLLGDSVTTRKEPPCGCSLCDPGASQAAFLKDFNAGKGHTGNHDASYALLPPRLHAYNIIRKSWGQVHIDDIVVEELNEKRDWDTPWENLVLRDSHKENIKRLAASHFTRLSESNTKQDSEVNIQDLVRRKGDGVVILLHGK